MEGLLAENESELTRVQFLDHELDLCETLLNTAAVEIDDPAAALMARSKAQEAYDTVLTWIASIRGAKERDRLMNKLFDLKKGLDDFDGVRSPRTSE